MSRPRPARIFHFTHIRNLPGIIANGLRSDADCREDDATQVQIGASAIRQRRLTLTVDAGPGGCVGDYVPWYFAPRSPMMFTLGKNNYEYRDGFDEVVYLECSVERILTMGLGWVATDRNAALAIAEFVDDPEALESHVTWSVMRRQYWGDHGPDGKELRMAEFLVHRRVPWEAVQRIVVKKEATKEAVERLLEGQAHAPEVVVRRDWYF